MTPSFPEGKKISICWYLLLNSNIFHISLKTACKKQQCLFRKYANLFCKKIQLKLTGKECLKGTVEIRTPKCYTQYLFMSALL